MPLYQTDSNRILFLDIETVRQKSKYQDLSPSWQELWDGKSKYQRGADESPSDFYVKRAAIMAEFGKVVCVSCGFFTEKEGKRSFRIKSFYGHDEKQLLQDFADLLYHHFDSTYLLCAHNGKEFDFPYLSRRMVVHGIKLPSLLNTSGLKPWEVKHLDTMEMWKFGDYKHFSSVKLLAALFDIPTPKDDIDGSKVGAVYWEENDLQRIAEYCQKDTVTVARIFLKMEGLPSLTDDEIVLNA